MTDRDNAEILGKLAFIQEQMKTWELQIAEIRRGAEDLVEPEFAQSRRLLLRCADSLTEAMNDVREEIAQHTEHN